MTARQLRDARNELMNANPLQQGGLLQSQSSGVSLTARCSPVVERKSECRSQAGSEQGDVDRERARVTNPGHERGSKWQESTLALTSAHHRT